MLCRKMCQIECENICQIRCPIDWQMECYTACQETGQIECQISQKMQDGISRWNARFMSDSMSYIYISIQICITIHAKSQTKFQIECQNVTRHARKHVGHISRMPRKFQMWQIECEYAFNIYIYMSGKMSGRLPDGTSPAWMPCCSCASCCAWAS